MLGLSTYSEIAISSLPILNYVDANAAINASVTVNATANFDARAVGATSVSSSTASSCERVKDAVSAVSADSTTTSACLRVRLSAPEINAESSVDITGRFTARGFADIDVDSQTLINYERVRYLNAASTTATSGVVSVGREKWEPIINDANIWTEIAP